MESVKEKRLTSPPSAEGTTPAAQLTALLDQIEAAVPNYTRPDRLRAPSVHSNARFANELIVPTIAAVTNYEPLRQRNRFDVEHGRQALQMRDELRPIQQRLQVIVDSLAYTIDSQLAECAIEALQTYRWSQHHVRHAEGDALVPYVEEMKVVVKKALGRRGKAKPSADKPALQGAMAELMEKAQTHDAEEVGKPVAV